MTNVKHLSKNVLMMCNVRKSYICSILVLLEIQLKKGHKYSMDIALGDGKIKLILHRMLSLVWLKLAI